MRKLDVEIIREKDQDIQVSTILDGQKLPDFFSFGEVDEFGEVNSDSKIKSVILESARKSYGSDIEIGG